MLTFNRHSELAGSHAFLSASKYHWINYDEDKLVATFRTAMAAQKGTELHNLAADLIKHKIKLPRSRTTLNNYVNDAIGFRMIPEQVLMYSLNCFGTADAISFNAGLLRIHDLKTGTNPCSMHQLEVYAALFCLEYDFKPGEIDIELRMYQNDDVERLLPEIDQIVHIMGRIKLFDKLIDQERMEALS